MGTDVRKTKPDQGARLRLIRERLAPHGFSDHQARFAGFIGVQYKAWNNYELGYPLPVEAAELLVAKFPGVTLDWIYSGRAYTLSVEIALRLGVSASPDTQRKLGA